MLRRVGVDDLFKNKRGALPRRVAPLGVEKPLQRGKDAFRLAPHGVLVRGQQRVDVADGARLEIDSGKRPVRVGIVDRDQELESS